MKKFVTLVSSLFLILFISGCGGGSVDLPEGADSENTYRVVTVAGDLWASYDDAEAAAAMASGSSTGLAFCVPAGEYFIEMFFPIDGGEPFAQTAEVTLTDYQCYFYGTAQECNYELAETDWLPKSFDLIGFLQPDGNAGDLNDVFTFVTPDLPGMDSVSVTWTCSGPPGTYYDPSAFMHLLMVFYPGNNDVIELNVGLDEPVEGALEPMELVSPLGTYTVEGTYSVTEVLEYGE